jgi:hypothetical protein
MHGRVRAWVVLGLLVVAVTVGAGPAAAQPGEPPAGRGCHGIDTARAHGAGARRQGPQPSTNPITHPVPPFGGCPPSP